MKMHRIGMIALAFGLLAVGCARQTAEEPGGGSVAPPTEAAKGASVKMEVAVFQGGYGLDFFEKKAQEYAEKKGIEVKVWGNPRIWEQLRTRFVSGDVPDLSWPGWGMDVWALVYEGQVKAMDD
jgi:ABC-type glycerol-3-phosphate transport system substrate-binding protein